MASAAAALDVGGSMDQATAAAGQASTSSHRSTDSTNKATAAASKSSSVPATASSSSTSSSTSQASTSSGVAALPAELGDQWEHNKPVEMRCAALNEEMSDCLSCFWRWVTCGGPGARVRQLYVNGRLSRCMDDYTKFKNCLALKLDPEAEVKVLPGPHPLWHIRTRRQAHEFWSGQYEHLGARRRDAFGQEEGSGVGADGDVGPRRRRNEGEGQRGGS